MRYAETRGHEFDYTIPNAYQYRDYVIRALNADVPYNQFVIEHLAGDLLPKPRLHPTEGFNESILGTGFWFLGEAGAFAGGHSPGPGRPLRQQDRRAVQDVPRPDGRLCPLPRSQVRRHLDEGLLRPVRLPGEQHYRLARFDSLEHNRARRRGTVGTASEGPGGDSESASPTALRPGTERLADYLLAAREAMLAPAEARRALKEIAKAHKLDAAILGRWITHLKAAARDENDPLHAWAKVAVDRERRVGRRARPTTRVGGPTEEAHPATTRTQLIIDYAHCKPEDWLTDGFAFGPGPVRPGELHVRGNAEKPSPHFSEYAAAEKDATWDVLKLAPGTQNDPGALGGVVRAGRTLRTPTFPLTTGKVFYLVKGSGFVYAAVGSHVMIAGPLHGQIVRTVNAGKRFQWIEHDLSAYQGQRIHLEFTPTGSGPFAVAQVASGGRKPRCFDGINRGLAQLPLANADSLDVLAQSYQDLFLDTLSELSADHLVGSADAIERARLANWMIGHSALFGSAGPAARRGPRLPHRRGQDHCAHPEGIAPVRGDDRRQP